MNTLASVSVPEDAEERERRIRQKSIENYTPWSHAEVEEWFQQRYPRPDHGVTASTVTDYD